MEKPANGVPQETTGDKVRVLLVEDNAANALVTTTYLQDLGLNYDIARNGREALEKYTAHQYGLILMDIQMPDMNGYEVTQWVRNAETHSSHPATPIIAMTAFASIDSRDKCMQVGMNDYIAKPFKPEELRNKILSFVH
jgi:CheY-like chemotaxis protein